MKKIGLFFLVVVVIVSVLLYYFWQEATRLPDWYTAEGEQKTELRSGAEIRSARNKLAQRIKESASKGGSGSGNVQLTLSEDDLNDLIVDGLVRQLGEEKILDIVKGSKTVINDGRLETGLVLNFSDLPLDQLDYTTRSAAEKMLETFTFLKEQDVYVGVQGTPKLIDGKLVADDSYQIILGNLTFTPAELAGKLGLESAEKTFNLDLGDLSIDDISLQDNQATVTGRVK